MIRTISRRCPVILFVMLFILARPPAAGAQSPGRNTPVDHQQILSVNPITSMFKIFNAEYERKLTPATTWGAEGSFLNIGGFDYRSANVLVRFYPQQSALAGFFVGGRAGVHHVAVDSNESIGVPSANFFGAGIDIGYSWLLGPKRNVGVSIGLGAERLFGGTLSGAALTIPSLRLVNIGIAF
jgi:hypothetical protein